MSAGKLCRKIESPLNKSMTLSGSSVLINTPVARYLVQLNSMIASEQVESCHSIISELDQSYPYHHGVRILPTFFNVWRSKNTPTFALCSTNLDRVHVFFQRGETSPGITLPGVADRAKIKPWEAGPLDASLAMFFQQHVFNSRRNIESIISESFPLEERNIGNRGLSWTILTDRPFNSGRKSPSFEGKHHVRI